ncbi:hypothetical protein RsTz2092_01840 [Deferribacterales bacterium RsTz2092]|nr:hypothetical protein AGMMS49941_02130 [Deferribacterales bacterium]
MLKHVCGRFVAVVLVTTALSGCGASSESVSIENEIDGVSVTAGIQTRSGFSINGVTFRQGPDKLSDINISTKNFFFNFRLPLGVAFLDVGTGGKCQFSDNRLIKVKLFSEYDGSKATSYITLEGGTKIEGKLVADKDIGLINKIFMVKSYVTELEYYFPMSCADRHQAVFTIEGITKNNQPIPPISMRMIDFINSDSGRIFVRSYRQY